MMKVDQIFFYCKSYCVRKQQAETVLQNRCCCFFVVCLFTVVWSEGWCWPHAQQLLPCPCDFDYRGKSNKINFSAFHILLLHWMLCILFLLSSSGQITSCIFVLGVFMFDICHTLLRKGFTSRVSYVSLSDFCVGSDGMYSTCHVCFLSLGLYRDLDS